MATDLTAFTALINLVADAAKDTAAAVQPGESVLARISCYENLITDVTALIPTVGELPTEAKALLPADYVTLVESLVARLAISNSKAEAIVTASLKLITDIVSVIVPDVEAIVASAQAPTVVAAAPEAVAPAVEAPVAEVSPTTTAG